jgi:hypothetical protein
VKFCQAKRVRNNRGREGPRLKGRRSTEGHKRVALDGHLAVLISLARRDVLRPGDGCQHRRRQNQEEEEISRLLGHVWHRPSSQSPSVPPLARRGVPNHAMSHKDPPQRTLRRSTPPVCLYIGHDDIFDFIQYHYINNWRPRLCEK